MHIFHFKIHCTNDENDILNCWQFNCNICVHWLTINKKKKKRRRKREKGRITEYIYERTSLWHNKKTIDHQSQLDVEHAHTTCLFTLQSITFFLKTSIQYPFPKLFFFLQPPNLFLLSYHPLHFYFPFFFFIHVF